MLRLVTPQGVNTVHDRLVKAFLAPGHEIHHRNLATPGGSRPDATLYWRPDVGLWGYFPREPFGENNRWGCWFGTNLADPRKTLAPSIEINLPLDPNNRQAAGRCLIDDDGRFYLGHKGGLGGGRGGQMSLGEFARRIQGFVREQILRPEDIEEPIFILGAMDDDPDLLPRLQSYVAECERLRAYAKNHGDRSDEPGSNSNSNENSHDEFTPENESDGTGAGHPAERYEIRRLHGQVVNALQRKIGPKAINSKQCEMLPDLYIRRPNFTIQTLFEVKASSDTQSWFTALGQLVVYGASQSHPPKRILVCPAIRKDPNFQHALRQLAVTVIEFKEKSDGSIEFEGLDAVLCGIER